MPQTSPKKKPFVHPNFAIDLRVERKYRKHMPRFIEIATRKILKLRPNLRQEEIHGRALAYVLHQRAKCTLKLKKRKRRAAAAPAASEKTPVSPPTSGEETEELFTDVDLLKLSLRNLREFST